MLFLPWIRARHAQFDRILSYSRILELVRLLQISIALLVLVEINVVLECSLWYSLDITTEVRFARNT